MARGLAIAFAASLLVNVFLGGLIAGKWVAERDAPVRDIARGEPPRGAPPPRGDILGDVLAFSPEARAAVRKAARGRSLEIRRDREKAKQLRTAVRDALTAEPFDRDAAETALRAMSESRGALESGRMSLMLDVFESLPPTERRALVKAQEERIRERRNERRRFERRPRSGPPMIGPEDSD